MGKILNQPSTKVLPASFLHFLPVCPPRCSWGWPNTFRSCPDTLGRLGVLLCTFWACNGHLACNGHHRSKMPTTMSQNVSGQATLGLVMDTGWDCVLTYNQFKLILCLKSWSWMLLPFKKTSTYELREHELAYRRTTTWFRFMFSISATIELHQLDPNQYPYLIWILCSKYPKS